MADSHRFSSARAFTDHLEATGAEKSAPPALHEPHLPVEAVLVELTAAREITLPDGSVVPLGGQTLRELRAEAGGDHGHLTDPMTGRAVPVSLDRWNGRDPDTTRIAVSFRTASRLAD